MPWRGSALGAGSWYYNLDACQDQDRRPIVSRFVLPVRVYYEDTDAGGVVYYANYLKFFERARTEFLRSCGFEQDELREQEGVLFAVRSVQVDYLRPARFNDFLTVTAMVTSVKRVRLDFEQAVEKGGEVLCLSQVKIACLDSITFKPRPIPEKLWKVLLNNE